jgi:hypothetical protein
MTLTFNLSLQKSLLPRMREGGTAAPSWLEASIMPAAFSRVPSDLADKHPQLAASSKNFGIQDLDEPQSDRRLYIVAFGEKIQAAAQLNLRRRISWFTDRRCSSRLWLNIAPALGSVLHPNSSAGSRS